MTFHLFLISYRVLPSYEYFKRNTLHGLPKMCKGLRGQSNGSKPRLECIETFLHEHASLQVSNKPLNSKNIMNFKTKL